MEAVGRVGAQPGAAAGGPAAAVAVAGREAAWARLHGAIAPSSPPGPATRWLSTACITVNATSICQKDSCAAIIGEQTDAWRQGGL